MEPRKPFHGLENVCSLRPIVDHMLKKYDGVLRIEGEVGNKKIYDPRVYLKLAEVAMAERVKQAVEDLRSAGTTLCEA